MSELPTGFRNQISPVIKTESQSDVKNDTPVNLTSETKIEQGSEISERTCNKQLRPGQLTGRWGIRAGKKNLIIMTAEVYLEEGMTKFIDAEVEHLPHLIAGLVS